MASENRTPHRAAIFRSRELGQHAGALLSQPEDGEVLRLRLDDDVERARCESYELGEIPRRREVRVLVEPRRPRPRVAATADESELRPRARQMRLRADRAPGPVRRLERLSRFEPAGMAAVVVEV